MRTLKEADVTPSTAEKVEGLKQLFRSAFATDGAHHKQWYLEEIAGRLGFDVPELLDCNEPGIAP